jgi:hypothetical protein
VTRQADLEEAALFLRLMQAGLVAICFEFGHDPASDVFALSASDAIARVPWLPTGTLGLGCFPAIGVVDQEKEDLVFEPGLDLHEWETRWQELQDAAADAPDEALPEIVEQMLVERGFERAGISDRAEAERTAVDVLQELCDRLTGEEAQGSIPILS